MAEAQVLVFNLKKQAAKGGGDRYTCESEENFDIYIPQKFSRENGIATKSLSLRIERRE